MTSYQNVSRKIKLSNAETIWRSFLVSRTYAPGPLFARRRLAAHMRILRFPPFSFRNPYHRPPVLLCTGKEGSERKKNGGPAIIRVRGQRARTNALRARSEASSQWNVPSPNVPFLSLSLLSGLLLHMPTQTNPIEI